MNYGKLNNGQLEVITFIDHDNSRTIGINAETAQQFGLKEIVDIKPTFYNYEVNYSETDTQIIVNYTEVQPPAEAWEYQTNFKIKMSSDRFVAMVSEVNAIVPDVSRNVSNFGITEIYLDVIDDEFRTLVNYFDENIIIIERK